jgi:hypothetical protein
MNCSNFKENFSAYIDGGLSAGLQTEAENHLKSCRACAGMLEAYQAGIGIFRKATEIDPPDDMFERVMAEVNGSAPARVIPLRQPVRRNVLAAAAVVMIALMGSLIFTGSDRVEITWNPGVDSTMDVVNAEEIIPDMKSKDNEVRRPAQKAYLAAYNGEEEPSFSYGVSNHPLIVESGVSAVGE